MKKFRIYFNKKEDYPCIWSVDEGTPASEIRVQWFSIGKLNVWANTRLCPTQPHNAPEYSKDDPAAWIEVEGCADFQGGGVVFKEIK